MARKYRTEHIVRGVMIPIQVSLESRRDVRVSAGKECVYLRLPYWTNQSQQAHYLKWSRAWIEEQFAANDNFKSRYRKRYLQDGDTLNIRGKEFHLSIRRDARNSARANLDGNYIDVVVPEQLNMSEGQAYIRGSLNALICKVFLPPISRRVQELNALHFQKPIRSVKLRYMTSKWGSCSATGKISLSARLLFAPQAIVDYVIIHELSHLIELNHSDRFWAIVKNACPNYEESERWLKEHGHLCDY